jgi:flagellar hook-length control protein FliK
MNQTNIDYLFQVIAPAADRATSASRSDSDAPGFDDHLNQASASALEVASPPRRSNSDLGYSTSDDRPASPSDDSSQNTSSLPPCNSTSSCQNDTSGAASSSADASQPNEVAGESEQPSDRTEDDKRDTEKADDDRLVEATIASPNVGTTPAGNPMAETHEAEHAAARQAEGAVAADETEQPNHTRGTTSDDSAPQADANAFEVNAELAVAAETETAASDSTDNTRGPAHSADETPEQAASRNEAQHGAQADASQAATAADDAKKEASKQEIGHSEITTDLAAVVKETAERAATASATPAKAEASTDDDSRRDGKKSARANTRGEVPAAANVSTTTAIANGVTSHIANVTDDVEKTKDTSDPATKPVAAKHETAVGPLGRALRATADITRGSRSTDAPEGPQVDPERFVGRVAKAFQTANERGGTLQLRLSPPELGALKIQLTVKDGVMSAALEAENSTARRLLLDHLPALRDRLAEQNIRIERFDVDVRQENSGGHANPRGSNHNPQQQQAEQSDARRAAGLVRRASEVALPEVPAVAPRISSTGINLVV